MPQTLATEFRKDFPPYVDGLVRSLPGNYVTTPRFAKKADDIYNFKPRDDDVYVTTFPKSGNVTSFSSLSHHFIQTLRFRHYVDARARLDGDERL